MRVQFYRNLVLVVVLSLPLAAEGQTNEFTYQGKLSDGSMPANGNYDFQFALFPTPSAGVLIGSRDRLGVQVSDGSFTVTLDFPATNFNGSNRYLEIRIRTAGSPDPYTILTPRQKVSSAPYAIQSLNSTNAVNATTATNSTQLGGVAASQFVQTNDSRLSDARNPLPGNPDYIQNNSGVPQTGNFSVSGSGLIGGNILIGGALTATSVNASNSGGYRIGATTVLSTAGTNNLFVGLLAGNSNTIGTDNSFFGHSAGTQNTEGNRNSFFGTSAGSANRRGDDNSFFGSDAGGVNNDGIGNSFFGSDAGDSNTSGANNSFFGRSAGSGNATGSANSIFGSLAGLDAGDGSFNSIFGYFAGQASTGTGNSFFGSFAGKSSSGSGNSFFGVSAGITNSTGSDNAFFGEHAGSVNASGYQNAFFGPFAGRANITGHNNTMIGASADVNGDNLTFATAIGAGAVATENSSVVLGRSVDIVYVPGFLRLERLGGAGTVALCRNNANTIGTCSSSLRYKTNIGRFGPGLDLVKRLKPITFDWKDGGMHDLGLGAEDVAAIEPLLVTYNESGQVEGVKYDRIGVVLVNAVKEQQAQIDELKKQQAQNHELKKQIEILKAVICQANSLAAGCK